MVKKHLDSPKSEVEGSNAHELPCLIGAMEDEPLYQQFLTKMQEQEEASPQPSRKRNRSGSARPEPKKVVRLTSKAKAKPGPKTKAKPGPKKTKANAKAGPKKMPKPRGSARFEVPGPQSAPSGSGSSDSPSSEVPGLESTDTSSDLEPWELDTHEWVVRDCWVCVDCNSMNLRFTQWCVCGTQRELVQERRPGDQDCPLCGNLIFGVAGVVPLV